MKQIPLLLFIISLSFGSYSQQFGRINNFWQVYARSNPAQTNSFDSIEVNLIGRGQDFGINGAPYTFYCNYNQIFTKVHGSLGFSSEYDQIGISNTKDIKLNYTFRLKTKIGDWAFGTNVGIDFMKIGGNWILPQGLNDPIIFSFKQQTLLLDLGIAYKSNKLRLGFALLNNSMILNKKPIDFDYAPTYILNSAYHIKISDKLDSDIFFQFMTDLNYYTPDFGLLFNYKKCYNFGIIVNNFGQLDNIYSGLTAGYNHKSGIGLYSSVVFGGVFAKSYFEQPSIEIGLRFRRRSINLH